MHPQAETLPAPTSRSSILYALGGLEALVASHGERISAIPQQIALLMDAQIGPMRGTLADHSKRLSVIERWFWVYLGGGLVLMFLIDKGVPLLLGHLVISTQ